MPAWFQDGMVLQSVNQGTVLSRLHGSTAAAGERVVVMLDGREAASVSAGKDKTWVAFFSLQFMSQVGHVVQVQGETGPAVVRVAQNVTWGGRVFVRRWCRYEFADDRIG